MSDLVKAYEEHRQWLSALQETADAKRLEKTRAALSDNRMEAFIAEKKEDVLLLLKTLMKPGCSVSTGGSATLDECGVIEFLRSGDYDFLDRFRTEPAQLKELFRRALSADCYLMSANAITEDGLLYNVDGRGNRVAALTFGPDRIIVIAGINKIVASLDDAVRRVKEASAPLNCRRLNQDTPCTHTGLCAGRTGGMGAGCRAESRICNSYVVTARQGDPDRIKVILVNEPLGY